MIKRFYSTIINNSSISSSISNIYSSSSSTLPKVLVLSGSTGSGKSKVALELAEQINGEIICADSIQIYKHLTIGSNSLDTVNQKEVPFHLFSFLDFSNSLFNVFDYYRLAKDSIADIVSRGKTPILVGGCGFYLESILKGSREALLTPQERKEIEVLGKKIKESNEWYFYLNILKSMDSESAESITKNNAHRLAKSLYYNTIKNIKYSSLKNQFVESISNDYDFRCFYLTSDRFHKVQILNDRCDQMINLGLIQEVYDLLTQHENFINSKPSKSLGYKETTKLIFNQYPNHPPKKMHNPERHGDELTPESIINYIKDFKAATRQYSKRQDIWFKRDDCSNFHWVDIKQNNLNDLILNGFTDTIENFESKRDLESEAKLKTVYFDFKPPEPQIIRDHSFYKIFSTTKHFRNKLLEYPQFINLNNAYLNNNNNSFQQLNQ